MEELLTAFTCINLFPATASPVRPYRGEKHYRLYPISRIRELIDVVIEEPPLDEDLYAIRFVIDSELNARFAKEGAPNRTTPSHSQMLDKARCISAGTIRFSRDFSYLEIDHKSGGYRPDFASIAWLLGIITVFRDRLDFLPPTIRLKALTASGGDERAMNVDVREITNIINLTLTDEAKDILLRQPEEIKEVYSAAVAPRLFTGRPRMLNFAPIEEVGVKRERDEDLEDIGAFRKR